MAGGAKRDKGISATARCNGAATIVNAIASGRGAAFALGLGASVSVELGDGEVAAVGVEEPELVETCVRNALSQFKYDYGATVRVESDIPVARGLKSSSAVANAAVLAAFGALAKRHGRIKTLRIDKETSRQQLRVGDTEISDEMVLNTSIRSSKECGVTITGALDDAAASYFGGFVVTDNGKNRIMRRGEMEMLRAFVFVPKEKAYTKDFDIGAARLYSREADAVWNLALSGDLYTAMTLNGQLYAAALGNELAQEASRLAMGAGALAAGMSGTGPAVVAITRDNGDGIADAWQKLDGAIIESKVSNAKSRVVL